MGLHRFTGVALPPAQIERANQGRRTRGELRNIQQAFVTLKPPQAGGLELSFGKFVTSAGAEVIETHSNWNYSRSLLFAWAIPYYHFGLRASAPLTKNSSAGFQLLNGWNNVADSQGGRTVGLTGALATDKVTWSHNCYFGPERGGAGNKGLRHLYDTTLLLVPARQASLYVNFDYGTEKRVERGRDRWVGVAGAARLSPAAWLAVSPRIEWFNDADGFSTGTAQRLKEFTLTFEFRTKHGALVRPEYRHDWSDKPFFDRGGDPAVHASQTTLLVGLVVCFGPVR